MHAHIAERLPNLTVLSDLVAENCRQVPVSKGPTALANELARLAPQLSFRQVFERGGWYRHGGVVNAHGLHIANDLERWAKEELSSYGENFTKMTAALKQSQLKATRITGKTHYWTARTGDGATDFIQIEIEELQEIISHELFPDGKIPASLDDLVEPREASKNRQSAMGMPFYTFRRLTNISDLLSGLREQSQKQQPVIRFIEAWRDSSASQVTEFSNHWVIAISESYDQKRQLMKSARPIAAVNGKLPRFECTPGTRGIQLAHALQHFDKQIGYPMAWYFHMITSKTVPYYVATVVVEDALGGFDYLSDRDVQIVRDWLHQPFAF